MAINSRGLGYFYESARERAASGYEEQKSSFGGLQKGNELTFQERWEKLRDQYKNESNIDIQKDMRKMVGNRSFMEQYKTDLLGPIVEAFEQISPNDPHINSIVENVNTFWDTKLNMYTESSSMMGFLPIATLEFPVLVKQFFSSVLKDIIEVESVKTPNISKHIRTTYMVDNLSGEEYEYPKCMWDGTWQRIWQTSKGHKIREVVVPLDKDSHSIYKYDIISGLTDGDREKDKLSMAFKISAVQIAGKDIVPVNGNNGIPVEFSTGGHFINGKLNFKVGDVEVDDEITGSVDFRKGTVNVSSMSGDVTGVVFSGYLSNEKNQRTVSVREKRDILRFTIEDGARWNMPFSIEEIDDAAALLDLNYYNRMVDEIIKCQETMECMTVVKFLEDQFLKYNGVQTDIYKLESLANTYTVDLDTPVGYAGDPFSYRARAVQYKLKAILHHIAEMTKLEGLSYIIVGNPMACQIINDFAGWKFQSGTSIGGINVNNSYGYTTDLGATVRVVATNLYDPYTKDPIPQNIEGVEDPGKRELVLHIYCYPTDSEHITFRHLKYTSHLLTSQSQTAYQSTAAPGGAYNIVTATSRFHTLVVQGIQAELILLNSDKVYGEAFAPVPLRGAPWTNGFAQDNNWTDNLATYDPANP